MWHVSVSGGSADANRLKALAVLAGVGDAASGEWIEDGEIAVHVRRRLRGEEAALVGPVVDVRQTPEALRRFVLMQPYLPEGWTEIQ